MLITHPTRAEIVESVRLAFRHLPPNEFPARQQLIMNLVDAGSIEMDGFFIGSDGGVVVGVLISQLRPDGLISIWYPATLDNRSPQQFFPLLNNYAKSRNAPAIVLMTDKDQVIDEKVIFDNGFEYISDMLMLVANAATESNQTVENLNSARLKFIPLYSSCFEIPEAEHVSVALRSGCSGAKPTAHTGFDIHVSTCRERLIKLMAKTYVNTRDFPKLLELSPVDNILDEYWRNIFFRSDLWFFVQKMGEGEDIGVLLLSDVPPEHVELTYMGLIEDARGQGFSREIIQFAQNTTVACGRKLVTTIVDEQNAAALKSYLKRGFVAWDRKKVYAKFFV
ncbi:MAG: GNAT family N-acetyltransferase [Planctomycetaceae bacterium]|jgi:GNAT superfamily N-acetyltransferase|nr:GNAT family N-acetyltransferase [Planctomycetaceae bacterium]